LCAIIGFILVVELSLVDGAWGVAPEAAAVAAAPTPPITEITNTAAIGNLLYTKYAYLFQAAGLVLLVAMIGAIVLTLRQREGVRRQSISEQVSLNAKDAIEIKKVPSRSGV